MRLPTRTPRGRHFGGRAQHPEWPVRDELEPPDGPLVGLHEDIDIDAHDAWEDDDQPRARVARSRVAFAVAITLAALPVLFLDNFATADEQPDKPAEYADGPSIDLSNDPDDDGALGLEVDLDDPLRGTIDLEAPATLVTVAPPTVYVETPITTVTLAPVPTTAAPTTTAAPKPAPTTTTTAKPTTTTVRTAVSPSPSDPATWETLARCESAGNWAANTGNGYYGGLQFSVATWEGVGGTGMPHEADKATQIEMGKRLQARSGWAAWPGCARKLGWS